MRRLLSRRRFTGLSLASAGALLAPSRHSAAAPAGKILETRVISPEAELYHGWPTLTRTQKGELVLVWSGRRKAHVCPFGTVEMMTSRDGGATWSWPRTVHDGPIDDRDAGVLETSNGTVLVTTFTSLAYAPMVAEGGPRRTIRPGSRSIAASRTRKRAKASSAAGASAPPTADSPSPVASTRS